MTGSRNSAARGTLLVLNRDLMLGISIGNTAKMLGFTVERYTDTAGLAEQLENERSEVALAIVDMNLDVDWDCLADVIRAHPDATPILGFGPHVDIEGRRAAKQAGLTRIVSNGEFHRDMAGLIQRYASAAPDLD
jgi:hypothetical protein